MYLKRPENYEDRRTGPGIFFGGTELPKKPLERKTSEWTVHGGSARPPRRQRPLSTAGATALHGSSYRPPGWSEPPSGLFFPINTAPNQQF
ncbi:hypothetical protein JCGZ_09110 [Jatropha curcas]|uniref:Uncharacterized protein n=1 Tax=Jatropha curcas TaxID=180498 RepID=A0A067KHS3_JATCU|nr:hypothetical protein JCGZ_09110 [Jatropha curcas]